jgi:hypothetical protein
MKKVNIQNELNHLEEKKINRNWLGTDSGQAIKKTDLSEYVKDCYYKSKVVKCHPKVPLKYKYYFDEKNWVCILFTNSFIQDQIDDNKIKYEADTIIVKFYISEKEFYGGFLIQHIFFTFFEKDKNHWDLKNGKYETDCIKFNEFPIIKSIRRLK